MTPAVNSSLQWLQDNLEAVRLMSRSELRDKIKGFGVGRSEFRLVWKAHEGAKTLTLLELAKRAKAGELPQ